MKHRILFIVLPALALAPAACSPDESAQQKQQTHEQVMQVLERAQKNYAQDRTAENYFTPEQEAQRTEQLESDLAAALGGEAATRQGGAALLISEARATEARGKVADATVAYGRLMASSDQALTLANAAAGQWADAQALQRQIKALREAASRFSTAAMEAEAQLSQRSKQVTALKQQADGLEQQIQTRRQQREQAQQQASEFLIQAERASGQKRLDLHAQYTQARSRVDDLSAQIEKLTADLQAVRQELKIQELEQAQTRDRVERLQNEATQRRDAAEDLEDELEGAEGDGVEPQAAARATQLVERLNERRDRYRQRVATPLDEAAADLARAVEQLEQTRQGPLGDQAEYSAASKLVQRGLVLRQAAQADAGYAAHLRAVSRIVADDLPRNQAASIEQLAQQAAQQAQQRREAAMNVLNQAAAQLQDLKSRPAVLGQLATVYDSLADLHELAGDAERAEGFRAQAAAVRQGMETP